MPTLIVLRHLETLDNRHLRFGSGDRDCPLLPTSVLPAEVIEEVTEYTRTSYRIAHTELLRSEQTAQLLTTALGYRHDFLTLPELKERMGGTLAGLSLTELQQRFPSVIKPSDLWTVEDPQSGLESATDFFERISCGLARLPSLHSGPIILVAHAGSIKGMSAIVTTSDPIQRRAILQGPSPHNAQVFLFNLTTG